MTVVNKQIEIILIYDHGLHWKCKPTFTLRTSTMPKVKCLLPDCEFETEDLAALIVAALITAHSLSHLRGYEASGTSEEWAYFLSRLTDYVDATKIKGKMKSSNYWSVVMIH